MNARLRSCGGITVSNVLVTNLPPRRMRALEESMKKAEVESGRFAKK